MTLSTTPWASHRFRWATTGARLQYAFFFGVDANSPNKEAAWKFLQWLNTAQTDGNSSCMGTMLLSLGALTANKNDIAAAPDELERQLQQAVHRRARAGRPRTERHPGERD